jgi:hypothetical protein
MASLTDDPDRLTFLSSAGVAVVADDSPAPMAAAVRDREKFLRLIMDRYRVKFGIIHRPAWLSAGFQLRIKD